jgi:hypothetical protein
MTIKIIFTLALSLNCVLSAQGAFAYSLKPLKIATISKSKPKAEKFNWKRVFRPVKIFKRKVAFWCVAFLGIALILGLLFYVLDRTEASIDSDVMNVLLWILLGIFAISVLIVAVTLIALPIVMIIRIMEELRWKRRYRKCQRF